MAKIYLGIFFVIVGILFFINSQQLNFGTITNIGPGFFPKIISTITILLGLIIMIRAIKWKF
jgi:hypothetical protein